MDDFSGPFIVKRHVIDFFLCSEVFIDNQKTFYSIVVLLRYY